MRPFLEVRTVPFRLRLNLEVYPLQHTEYLLGKENKDLPGNKN